MKYVAYNYASYIVILEVYCAILPACDWAKPVLYNTSQNYTGMIRQQVILSFTSFPLQIIVEETSTPCCRYSWQPTTSQWEERHPLKRPRNVAVENRDWIASEENETCVCAQGRFVGPAATRPSVGKRDKAMQRSEWNGWTSSSSHSAAHKRRVQAFSGLEYGWTTFPCLMLAKHRNMLRTYVPYVWSSHSAFLSSPNNY